MWNCSCSLKCVHMKMIVLTGIKDEGRLYRNDDKLRRVREMFSWLIVRTAVKIPFFLKDQTNTWSASAWCWDYNIFHTTLTLRNLCKNLSLILEHADYFLSFKKKNFTELWSTVDETVSVYIYIYICFVQETNENVNSKKTTKIACERSWMHFLIFTFLSDTFESACEEVSSVFRLLRSRSNRFKNSRFLLSWFRERLFFLQYVFQYVLG